MKKHKHLNLDRQNNVKINSNENKNDPAKRGSIKVLIAANRLIA